MERRAAIRPDAAEAAAARAATLLFENVRAPDRAVVSAYWPMRDEFDPRPALLAAIERGHGCALPVVVEKRQPLVFRRWSPETELIAAPFGTHTPPQSAEVVAPDLLLVPLLAFDRAGWRLGYGGGFYDRTLAALRREKTIVAVGFAFADQEVSAVPRGGGDEPLDWIVTEREAMYTARDRGTADPDRI